MSKLKIYYSVAMAFMLMGCRVDIENEPVSDSEEEGQAYSTESVNHSEIQGYQLIQNENFDSDFSETWNEAEATYLVLNEWDENIMLSEGGTYVLSGELEGQLIVDVAKEEKVQLVLNEATITSNNGPAIYVMQADKVGITLEEGSENLISDSQDYQVNDDENNPNAAIFSQEDLTINGTGTLTVLGNYNHGIVSKDDLVITGGVLNIEAVNNGIKGKDSVAIYDGELSIVSGGDGIKSTHDTDPTKGWVAIDGGTLNIKTSSGDGIQAETILQVTNGEISIETAGGSEQAPAKANDNFIQRGTLSATQTNDEESDSTKGLKARNALYIVGGTLTIDAVDDGLHSDGDIYINAGQITLASGDDGIHADNRLQIDGGEILITRSYEGLEGDEIIINGGEIRLTASDDGVNASGPTSYLEINDGLLVIDAQGDGIDSNGNILMTGGTVLISGPTTGHDAAIDYDGKAEINGGIMVATGSLGMATTFGESSTQASFIQGYTSTQSAGTLLTLLNEYGETMVSFEAAKDYQSVVISTPELEVGDTYRLFSGGTVDSLDEDGLSFGTYTAGEQVTDIYLSGTVTTSGSIQTMGGGPGVPMRENNGPKDLR